MTVVLGGGAGRPRSRTTLLLSIGLALATAACGVRGLSFIEDQRVTIIAPEDRSEVRLPVLLEWEVHDFDITGPTDVRSPTAGYFAVFLNRAPQPPGEPLAWLAREDDACMAAPACPDEDWLRERDVHLTTDTSLTLDWLPTRRDGRRELNEATIILVDGRGHRIGEAAFAVEFAIVRGR